MDIVQNERLTNSLPLQQILSSSFLSSNITNEIFNSLYEIIEEIGRGGFSIVYKCLNKATKKIYAVKV